jgi:hypothetical protein
MLNEKLRNYIANLPIGTFHAALQPEDEDAIKGIDIDKLPEGIVTGSNLIQFPKGASPELKSCIALSLLAAQRVATNDSVVLTPQQWIDRHNSVLKDLNWQVLDGGAVDAEFASINVAVHEAITPFLMAALGPAAAVGSLIITALKQLKDMDKDSPWITLFDRESRRFDVTEYQFSVVEVVGDQVTLRLASARFDASFGRTQVLFFKVIEQHVTFNAAKQSLSTSSNLLIDMNQGLKAKLAGFTKAYIKSLPI